MLSTVKTVYIVQCSLYNTHRISTARKEKGWGRLFFPQIKPNWPLPYSTVPVPQLRDARPAGWVTYCSICASTMPRAQNRAGKGSILMWRRFTFPIFLLFIYDNTSCVGTETTKQINMALSSSALPFRSTTLLFCSFIPLFPSALPLRCIWTTTTLGFFSIKTTHAWATHSKNRTLQRRLLY